MTLSQIKQLDFRKWRGLAEIPHMDTRPELRQIPRQSNHWISKCGRIYFCDPLGGEWTEKIGGRQFKDRYVRVKFAFTENGVKKKVKHMLHHLILEAWIGPMPEGCEGMHTDDDRNHNHLDNLAWGTKSENRKQRCANGAAERGPNRPMVEKLKIAAQYPKLSYRLLADKYKMNMGTVWKIVNDVKKHLAKQALSEVY